VLAVPKSPNPSPRLKFGQSWWGARWLDALSHIDFSNRLPRGRTYANRGDVLELEVDGTRISSRVRGSRPQPYRIEINVPAFSAEQKTALLDRICADPVQVARLLNRELDPALLEVAAAAGVAVFPTRFSDLKMR
jgi:uncharacterized Zn finger protein